jgi:hypothetical protein
MESDPVIATLLTGGVYTVAEITPGMDAPTPFDEVGRIKPSALVRHEVSTAVGPRTRFDRQFVVVFFYDHAGYDAITEAMYRTREILHEQRIGGGAYEIRHVDTIDDQYDDAILAFMNRARFEATRRGWD